MKRKPGANQIDTTEISRLSERFHWIKSDLQFLLRRCRHDGHGGGGGIGSNRSAIGNKSKFQSHRKRAPTCFSFGFRRRTAPSGAPLLARRHVFGAKTERNIDGHWGCPFILSLVLRKLNYSHCINQRFFLEQWNRSWTSIRNSLQWYFPFSMQNWMENSIRLFEAAPFHLELV